MLDVENLVLSFFSDRLQDLKGRMKAINDANDTQDKQEASAPKLIDVAGQLEEASKEAHLRNYVDDSFENKLAQAQMLLRLQSLHENGKIPANLLVGGYTKVMKPKLEEIVHLAKSRKPAKRNNGMDAVEGEGLLGIAALEQWT